jgi:oligopeptide transport system substrate-binding protein
VNHVSIASLLRWLPRVLTALALASPVVVLGEPRVLHLGNDGEPETLDPHRYNLRLEETLLNDLFTGLTTFDVEGRPSPGCAEAWTVSDDGLRWTFRLREKLVWSDGRPLTSEDFVYSLRRVLDPKTAASLAHFLYPIANAEEVNTGALPPDRLAVTAPDPRTLEIRLAEPFPFFAERLMYPTGFPVPRHAIERWSDDWTAPGHMVSNGAFTLIEWKPQAHVRLARNARFFDAGGVGLDEVVYYSGGDANTSYNRFRAGELDAINGFPGSELPWVKAHLGTQLRMAPLLSIVYLVFNVTAPPFDDGRVREALALAIDRELLTGRVLRTGEVPSVSFVPAMVADYDPVPVPESGTARAERIERARALLDEAGYGADRPLEITLRYISGVDTKKVYVAVAALWREIGVRTRLHQAELKVHFADLRQANFQVAQAGWFGESHPEHYLGLLESGTGNVNYGRFSDPEFDALMAQAKRLPDRTERLSALRRAEAYVVARYPVVPLYSVMVRSLVDHRVSGWVANPRNVHPARFLTVH